MKAKPQVKTRIPQATGNGGTKERVSRNGGTARDWGHFWGTLGERKGERQV